MWVNPLCFNRLSRGTKSNRGQQWVESLVIVITVMRNGGVVLSLFSRLWYRRGYVIGIGSDIYEAKSKKAVKLAIEEADVILFIVDLPWSASLNLDTLLRMNWELTKKPVYIVLLNKADNQEKESRWWPTIIFIGVSDFWSIFDRICKGERYRRINRPRLLAIRRWGDDDPDADTPKHLVLEDLNVGKIIIPECSFRER